MGCPMCGEFGRLWKAEVDLMGECPCGYQIGKKESDVKMDYTNKTISELAWLIKRDWRKVNYSAMPYLDAMRELNNVADRVGLDSGKSVVLYFLSNASGWRGPVARAIKAELKGRVS